MNNTQNDLEDIDKILKELDILILKYLREKKVKNYNYHENSRSFKMNGMEFIIDIKKK